MDDYTAFPSASPVMIAMGVNSQVFVPVRSGSSDLPGNHQQAQRCHLAFNRDDTVGTIFRVSIPFAVKDESELKIQASV